MLSIALLGRLCICRGQQEISRFRTRRTASLLGYLACYPNRAHPREELMDLFWGEASFETRRSALRVALNALRQQLEGDDIPHGEVLVADRSSVRFATSRYSTDAAMFEDLLKQAAETDENSPGHWTLLTAAADAYHGPLLPVFDETWVLSERRRLEDAYFGAVRALTRHCIQQNDADQALVFARRTLQVDPLREESHRTLMRLYAKMGRPEAVRDQFADLTRMLRDAHLGEPTPPTRELVVQLCSSKPTASHLVQAVVANAHPPSLSSISEERLRLRGEVLHLCAGAGSLYGRETELDELRMLLDDRQIRLITIIGTGGVGKTRLAAEALKYAPRRFADSTYGVSLADLVDPGLLCRTILRAVCKDETEACSPLDSLVTALSGRPTLLVLDNFEHLLREDLLTLAPANPPRDGMPPATSVPDARSLIRDLVDRLPHLTLLVTSRQPLDLVGERVFVVLPLSVPSRTEPLSCLRVCPSVQLFEARANDIHRAFRLTERNSAAVAELCERLDGLPLAIEMAAAWAGILTPDQMLARLDRRLQLLVSERKDVDRKHRSLQATLDWSYALLSPEQQRCFRGLSVFRGGATAEAVEAVLCDPGALITLRQLQSRSLVLGVEQLGGSSAAIRLRLLETVRQYAAEQADHAERQDLARLHAVHFAEFVEACDRHMQGPLQEEVLDRLESEHDNIRAALSWAVDCEQGDVALRIAGALHHFWRLHGHLIEGRKWLQQVLNLRSAGEPTLARARALAAAWMLAWHHGDLDEAAARLDEGITIARALENPPGLASLLNNRGNLSFCKNDFDHAHRCYSESLAVRREIGDEVNQASPLNNLGEIARHRKEFAAARSYFEECLNIWRARGSQEGIAGVLHNLGRLALDEEKPEQASALLKESLAIRGRSEDRAGLIQSLESLAAVEMHDGNNERALILFAAAASLRERIGDPVGPPEDQAREQTVSCLRSLIEPDVFARIWKTGWNLDVDEMVVLALDTSIGMER